MIDLIIDLETLDTKVTSAIIGIGAVMVADDEPLQDIKDRNLHPLHELVKDDSYFFHIPITSEFCANAIRTRSNDTLDFWSKQDAALRSLYFNSHCSNTVGLCEALMIFSKWVSGLSESNSNIRVWGNGCNFDVGILESAFNQCDIDIPWDFWNIRDLRTLLEIANVKKDDVLFKGVKHYALDDAYHEAELLVLAKDKLACSLSLTDL